jgi:Peptidase M66
VGQPDGGESDAGISADGVAPGVDAEPDAAGPDLDPRLVEGLWVTHVEVYQAVQIPVVFDGAAVVPRNSPVVTDRELFVRVYVEPQATWTPRPVTAEILVGDSLDTVAVMAANLIPTGPSTEADIGSTFNFTVPGNLVLPTTRFAVRLTSSEEPPVADGVSHQARYPLDGALADLGAQSDDGGLQIVIVPIRYEYDGSNRLPDTSATQLAIIEDLLLSLYPISRVTLTVREVVGWNDPPVMFTGNFDFSDLNQYLSDLKVSDGAPSATYYYALVQPDVSFSDYCGGTCTTGQSFVVSSPENGDFRVGGGLGYSGERWAWTLAHELGHMHGRGHAPCEVSGSDTGYPYPDGSIGVWGYDPRVGSLHDPAVYSDLMGYCDDRWISDYNFQNFWDRIIAVNNLPAQKSKQESGRTRIRTLSLRPGGFWEWGRKRTVRLPTDGPTRTVEILSSSGTVLERIDAPEVRDSQGGSTLLVPLDGDEVNLLPSNLNVVTQTASSEPIHCKRLPSNTGSGTGRRDLVSSKTADCTACNGRGNGG